MQCHGSSGFFEATVGRSKFLIQRSFAETGNVFMARSHGVNNRRLILEHGKWFACGRHVQDGVDQGTYNLQVGVFTTFAELSLCFDQRF
ncbi:hypothetical protein D3C78_1250030 [compost metagenome]